MKKSSKKPTSPNLFLRDFLLSIFPKEGGNGMEENLPPLSAPVLRQTDTDRYGQTAPMG